MGRRDQTTHNPWNSRRTSSGQARSEAPPTHIARYELIERIGEGGTASVYLARDTSLDGFERRVALKRLNPDRRSDPAQVDMFFHEARLLTALNHPSICRALDFGEDAGECFIVFELLDGRSLDDVCRALKDRPRREPPCYYTLANIVGSLLEGVHASHELRDEDGVSYECVHRDLKPANLFALFDGTVRVLDFGVARTRGRKHPTRRGWLKGTVPFMAPEYLEDRAWDHRVDVWSMGVVLWELLARERLFTGATVPDIVQAICSGPFPSPRDLCRDLPDELAGIAMQALARDPDRRYRSAREMALALHGAAATAGYTMCPADIARFTIDLFPRDPSSPSRLGVGSVVRPARQRAAETARRPSRGRA